VENGTVDIDLNADARGSTTTTTEPDDTPPG
jgi:hypothetical protein